MPSIKMYKDDIKALLLLPEKQFAIAINTILEVHDRISDRDKFSTYIGKIPSMEELEKIELPEMAKKRVIKILTEMPEDIEKYWKRAETNAINRAKGGFKR